MELTYHPIPPYTFYSIDQCTYLQLISRSKHSIYLYQHNQSKQQFAVKQIPFSHEALKIYDTVKRWQHFQSLVRIRGMCLMVISDTQNSKNTRKKPLINIDNNEGQNTNNNLQLDGNRHLHHNVEQRYFKCKKTLLIWMQYYPNDLNSIISKRRRQYNYFTKAEVKNFLLQIVTILQILQQNGLSHRDIKPSNILYQAGRYRLCDFDDSILQNSSPIDPTTICYTSPSFLHDLMNRSSIHPKVFCPYKMDVYALGLTFLHLCSMGKFKPQYRLEYLHNPPIHEQFIKEQRRKYVKDNEEYHQFNIILKIMLEKDEYKRDDFKVLMMRIKQGISGFSIDNRLKNLHQQQSSEEKVFYEQDYSEGASKFNPDHKKLRESRHTKRERFGATQTQGNLLIVLFLIAFTVFFLMCILKEQ